jgi:hypothetical protein
LRLYYSVRLRDGSAANLAEVASDEDWAEICAGAAAAAEKAETVCSATC